MSEVDSVGPFLVHQEWPGRHLNSAVKIAVKEFTEGQLDLELTNQNNRHDFLRPYVKSDE